MEGHLLENRSNPQRSYAHVPQITEFAGEPLQGAAHPYAPGVSPFVGFRGGLDGVFEVLVAVEKRCRAACYGVAGDVLIVAFFAVGEAVGQQKVEHLVFPGQGRRMKTPPQERLPIQISQTFFHHWYLRAPGPLCPNRQIARALCHCRFLILEPVTKSSREHRGNPGDTCLGRAVVGSRAIVSHH